MTAVVHGLLHLPEVVKHLGPIWAHSCFPFESANGDILHFFHGSQGIDKQVSCSIHVTCIYMHCHAVASSLVILLIPNALQFVGGLDISYYVMCHNHLYGTYMCVLSTIPNFHPSCL